MKAIATIALASLLAGGALADEYGTHLEPEASRWEAARSRWDDSAVIVAVFPEAFARDVQVRMYYPHPGKPMPLRTTYEGVVALETYNGAYRILHLRTLETLGLFTEAARDAAVGLPDVDFDKVRDFSLAVVSVANYQNVEVERCKIDVPKLVGDAIIDVWRRVLNQTRLDTRHMGMDGETYSFWIAGDITGSIWSPSPNTEPGMLLAVANAMANYCGDRTQPGLTALVRSVAILGARLYASRR